MKKLTLNLRAALMLGLIAGAAQVASAQTTTVTSVTSSGTVSEFSPNSTMEVKVDSSPTPIHYTFSKTTTYVDENGNPVSVETVKEGAPVVVYYEKNGDQFVADKVVVKKSVTTTAPTDIQPTQPQPVAPPSDTTTSTTSTTTTPPQAPPTTPPSVDGTISEADSDDISIRTASSEDKVHYKAHDYTAYVDQSGAPVSRHSLKEGTPVTVYFERDGDGLSATRVVLKNPPTTVDKTTVVTPMSQ